MSQSGQVLLVDDDRDILEGVSLRLRSAGYQTLVAHDGEEAVACARHYAPDAIVLDVRMPEMDGMEALAELKMDASTKDIPVVMLSASLVDLRRALEAGARYFIVKPFAAQKLLAALEAAIHDDPPAPATERRPKCHGPALSAEHVT